MSAASPTTILSTKGQVLLPKAVRDQLGWGAGTWLAVEPKSNGVLLRPLTTAFAPTRPKDVLGCLGHKGRAKSVEEMRAGIAIEANWRHAQSQQ